MHTPAEPNSDGWISFQPSPDGRYDLVDADRFVLPHDMKSGDRAIDPCAIGYFPPHVKAVSEVGDLGALEVICNAFYSDASFFRVLRFPGILAQKGKFDTDLKRLHQLEQDRLKTKCELLEAFGIKTKEEEQAERDNRADYTAAQCADVLFSKAKQGDPIAAERLLSLVILLTRMLDQLDGSPKSPLAELQKWNIRWPRLVSNHPFYRTDAAPPEKLGAGYPFQINSSSRWDPENPITQVAVHLIVYLTRLRQALKRFKETAVGGAATFTEPMHRLLQLGNLQENAPAWWEEAWGHFTESYPKPEEETFFQRWVQGESHKKSPGRIRERIRSKLRDTFLSVSGYSKLHPR